MAWTQHRETERLRLRDVELGDLDSLIPAWVNPEVARFMDDYGPRTADEVRHWLRAAVDTASRDTTAFGWAIELKDTGEVVGWIGFGESERGVADVDFAYVLARRYRGFGYASEALTAVVSFCSDELGVTSIWGECAVDNHRSAAVMERAGLRPIGVVDGQRRFALTLT